MNYMQRYSMILKRGCYMEMKRVCLFMATTILLSGCSGTRPTSLGVKDGRLSACPKSHTCVSTYALDKQHRIESFKYYGLPDDAVEKLKRIILSMKRTKIVTSTGEYIHAEFTSAIFRFVDDVEFYIDDSSKTINFRSASRMGKLDLGVNRRRMEEIRARFNTH